MDNHKIDSQTIMYGVFGDPIKQSKSPIMLNRAFQEAGINAAYAAYHVLPEQLGAAIEGIKALQYGGVNVTIPHKVKVMSFLDEIDEGARVIGAVNTVVNDAGRWIGYNTDGIGYVRSLKEETGVELQGKRILIIGAGGAARGVVYALSQEQPEMIWIANRTEDKADKLAEHMKHYANCSSTSLSETIHIMKQVDVVINTTAVGMYPNIEHTPLETDWLHDGMIVSDLIYNPLTTKWLREAELKGCTTHGGLGMFVYQGAYAFEFWTGRSAPIEAMRNVVQNSL